MGDAPSDNRPFPIQKELSRVGGRERPACTIPWWLSEVAHVNYVLRHDVKQYGKPQTLGEIADKGGFGRQELLDLLKGE